MMLAHRKKLCKAIINLLLSERNNQVERGKKRILSKIN